MASAAALYMASLTILGVLLGRIILKEEISWLAIASLIICLFGISLILLGLTNTINESGEEMQEFSKTANQSNKGSNHLNNVLRTVSKEIQFKKTVSHNQHRIHTGTIKKLAIGVCGCIFCGLAEAVSIVSLKYIQDDISEVHILTFWMGVSGLIFSIIVLLIHDLGQIDYPRNISQSLYLAGHALAIATGQCVYVLAMEKTPAHVISILLNAQIPTNMLFQYVIVRNLQPISGSIYDIIGACIVTLGLVLPPVANLCKSEKRYIEPTTDVPLLHK